jgi:hypothetical protein
VMTPTPFAYSLLQTPADAILSWLGGVSQRGPGFHGIIFTTSDRDADTYLRAAERVMPSGAVRHRNFHGPVIYQVDDSDLYLEILRDPFCHHAYGTIRKFVCFDNPAAWSDGHRIETLLKRLAPPGCHIVAVGSRLTMPSPPETKPPIDFFAINRDFCR